MTKFKSVTTPKVEHDAANAVVEMILLNNDLMIGESPWRNKRHGRWWGKMVACIKKLMREHEITADQMAFYVLRCRPTTIDSTEFGKMAVVAKKLLRRQDIGQAMDTYRNRRDEAKAATPIAEGSTRYKRQEIVSLTDFLRELEDGEA